MDSLRSMPPPKTEMLEFVCPLPKAPQGFREASVSVSTAGEALLLLIGNDHANDAHGQDNTPGASFPRTKMPEGKPFRLIAARPGGIAETDSSGRRD